MCFSKGCNPNFGQRLRFVAREPGSKWQFHISHQSLPFCVITGWLLFLSGGFCGQRHGYWAGSDVYFFVVIDVRYVCCMKLYVGMFPKPLFQCSCRAPWGPADSGHVFGCTLTGATRGRFSAPKAGDLERFRHVLNSTPMWIINEDSRPDTININQQWCSINDAW